MLGFLEFLTSFYWLLLPETLIATLRHANWRRAYGRHGPGGLLLETAESIIGTNTYISVSYTHLTLPTSDLV